MSDENKPVDEPVQSPQSTASAAATGDVGVEQLKAMITALQTDLDKRLEEVAGKHDQYLRAVA